MTGRPPAYVCPRCRRTSHDRRDVETGHCPACRELTGQPCGGQQYHWWPTEPATDPNGLAYWVRRGLWTVFVTPGIGLRGARLDAGASVEVGPTITVGRRLTVTAHARALGTRTDIPVCSVWQHSYGRAEAAAFAVMDATAELDPEHAELSAVALTAISRAGRL